MDKNLLSDEDLMIMYQSGSIEAFEELYERYSDRIYSYLRSRLPRHSELVDELYQDCFLKLHRFKMRYSDQYSFSAWFYTIARNTYLDMVKKSSNQQIFTEFTDAENYLAPEIDTQDHDTKKLFGDLSSTNKKAMEMRYIEDKSFDEIAEVLGSTSANIRKRISRSMKQLRLRFGTKGGI